MSLSDVAIKRPVFTGMMALCLLVLGILGEYIGRIYEEIKQRPLYVVQDKIGFDM